MCTVDREIASSDPIRSATLLGVCHGHGKTANAASAVFPPLLLPLPSPLPGPRAPRRGLRRMSGMAIVIRRRTVVRVLIFAGLAFLFKLLISPSSDASSVSSLYDSPDPTEIRKRNVLDLAFRSDKLLDARKHQFLQVRMGRDERPDLFKDIIDDGVQDYWERFQKP